ncbi:MFS transporter [Prevotella denticola]|uniref:Nucleoside-transport system protein nupG n=1 Tax=Prevotella denticola TaxID=28129 RepID=A0A379EEV3_9BACT|nr:MFS transporter [Prevotella denticola]MBW4713857.1 MFS transporter [Prevotella denticola]MBW4751624.1 MFS transporter [Prevotella denticola]SUB94623.1 Nucleoside-transport system protein nupG [Prevotella denticola]
MNLKVRLALMNFLEFAVWGAYLTSMGRYLERIGIGTGIGWFYSMQGVMSIFMPALMGIVADRWVPAQRLLGFCHLLAGLFMFATAGYGLRMGNHVESPIIFTLYSLSVAFYMPTLALTNSVAYSALTNAGMDTVKDFPPIRVFGTIGFILTMWLVDLLGFQSNQNQFVTSGAVSIILFLYAFTLPKCEVSKGTDKKSFVDAFGLRAFTLFKQKKMAIFFIFSMLLGVSLQITNGFANPFLSSFGAQPEFAQAFGVQHANILISLSQISETCCILLIPFFMRHYGIKNVMLIAMFAWVLRFGLFGVGNPGFPGVLLFVLSMIVYGVAFDFFNISGSLFVDNSTEPALRSSAQGLFMLMTNGIGATIGTLAAQAVINVYTHSQKIGGDKLTVGDWQSCWFIFAGYAFAVGVSFALIFRPKKA